MKTISAKRVWTSNGWVENARVHMEGPIIRKITQDLVGEADVPVLIPGMIDLHIHGCIGYNCMSHMEAEKAESWLHSLAVHGVTGVLPGLSTAPVDSMRKAMDFFTHYYDHPAPACARVHGIHLEGPFCNPVKKGGMNENAMIAPTVENYEAIVGDNGYAVRLLALAPELPGAVDLIRWLTLPNVPISACHSNATCEEMVAAIEAGLTGVTHFFNAARPIGHRDPGLLTAAIIDPRVFCELVGDQVHVRPEVMRMLIQAVGPRRITLITDCGELTGLPDGRYGDLIVVDGSPRKLDGTLTGSCKLMDRVVRDLIQTGFDPWEVFCMACNTPAKRIGLTTHGDIAPQYTADLVAMTDDYQILYTLIDGEKI